MDESASIRLIDVPERLPFDADPALFRLGIEARQIQVSFEHDMAALAVSNIQPLPHQIEAVYDCFLREPRLRFLLADDPGAGKTIMAGLYMKELILRRAGDRILVVTPANLRPQWDRELAERFELDFVQLDSAMFDASPTHNPWDQHDRVIVSRDFLKAERVREAFEAADREWDLAIIDEAHGYTIATRRQREHQGPERAVQGSGAVSRKSAPSDPVDCHPPFREGREPVGSAPSARPGRMGGPVPPALGGARPVVPQGAPRRR